jgi:hypothetical protein
MLKDKPSYQYLQDVLVGFYKLGRRKLGTPANLSDHESLKDFYVSVMSECEVTIQAMTHHEGEREEEKTE